MISPFPLLEGENLSTLTTRKKHMFNTIQEATEVSLNAYNRIELENIGSKNRDQFRFLGQCLSVLTEQLKEENDSLSERTEDH